MRRRLKPAFETSEKTDRIAGWVILTLASTFIGGVFYILIAEAVGIWPF